MANKEDFGAWLVRRGDISAARMEDVFQHQVIYGGSLDTSIVEMSLLEEAHLLDLMGQFHGLPTASREALLAADPDKLKIFPPKLALKYAAIPFRLEGRNLSLAVNQLPDLGTLDDIGFMLSVYIRPCVALEVRLQQAFLRMYGTPLPARMENLLAQLGEDTDEDRAAFSARQKSRGGPPPLPADAVMPARPSSAPARGGPPPLPRDAGDRIATPASPPPLPDDAAARPAGPPPLPADAAARPSGPPPLPRDAGSPSAGPPPLPSDAGARPAGPPPLPTGAGGPPPLPAEAAASERAPPSQGKDEPQPPGAASPGSAPSTDVPPMPSATGGTDEDWVAQERARADKPSLVPPSSLPPPLPSDAFVPSRELSAAVADAADDLEHADMAPVALGGLLSTGMAAASALDESLPPPSDATAATDADIPDEPLPEPVTDAADPVFDDPEHAERLRRRAEKVSWQLADARAELQLAQTRDDIVDVLLRFAFKTLDYAAVFILQGNQFNGWDSIGELEVPRALGRLRISPAPGSALALVEQTGSHYLGPLKPGDPLPAACNRARPRAALLVPFSVKGRLVGVLFGERGKKSIPPRAVADLQSLVPDVGRMLETLILRQKRDRMGFVDERSAPSGASIRQALADSTPPPPPTDAAPPPSETPAPAEPVAAPVVTPEPSRAPDVTPSPATDRATTPPAAAPPTPATPETHDHAVPGYSALDQAPGPPMPDFVEDAAMPAEDSAPPPLPPLDSTAATTSPTVEPTRPPTADALALVAHEQAGPPPSSAPPALTDEERLSEAAVFGGDPPRPTEVAAPTASTGAPLTPAPTSSAAPSTPAASAEAAPAPPLAAAPAHEPPPVAPPAAWGDWQPVEKQEPRAPITPPPLPPTASPPPLPKRTRTDIQGSLLSPAADQLPAGALDTPLPPSPPPRAAPPPMPEEPPAGAGADAAPPPPTPAVSGSVGPGTATLSLRDPEEANAVHAEELFKEAPGATADRTIQLADSLARVPVPRRVDEHLERACSRGREAQQALEVAAGNPALSLAAALRIFPGPLSTNVFADEGTSNAELVEVAPLCRVLARLGDVARVLAVAHGGQSARREARYVSVLLARETPHAGVADHVVRRVFDDEPRIAFLAASVLERMLVTRDDRMASARASLDRLRRALVQGTPAECTAAIRAAGIVHAAALVPPLVDLLDHKDRETAERALAALREITKQDFGPSARKWRGWLKDNAGRPRIEWLVEALAHKERDIRHDAQRELNQLTGEYLGYFHDAPRSERDAAVARWRDWVQKNRNRPEFA